MHKSETFLKNNDTIKKENNVIFLNIDGTIKNNSNNQEKHDLKKLKEYLSIKYNDSIYSNILKEDIGSIYYDIDNVSLGILFELIERYNANLVITNALSNKNNLEEIKALLRIYDLYKVVIDSLTQNKNNYNTRKESISNYISNNNIDNYLILDEYDYTKEFGENFRRTTNKLIINDINYANLIFNKKLIISENKTNISLSSDNKEILSFKYIDYNINNINVLYNKLVYIYCLEFGGIQYIEYLLNYLTKTKDVDYILLDLQDIKLDELNISGALDNNNIYTIHKSNNDTNHVIQECKRKILSIDRC